MNIMHRYPASIVKRIAFCASTALLCFTLSNSPSLAADLYAQKSATTSSTAMKARTPAINNDDFDGILAGGFIFYPQMEAQTTYDDNVFRSHSNPTTDYIVDVIPGISATTNWNRHALGMSANYDFGRYRNNSRSDYEGYNISANGRYDIAYETNLSGRIERNRKQAGATGFEDQSLAQDGYNTTTTEEASLERHLSYIQSKVYIKNRQTDFAKLANNNYLSSHSKTYGLDIGYAFLPNSSIFSNATLDDLDYTKTNHLKRTSEGYDTRLGIKYDSGSLYNWSLFTGRLHKSFNDNIDDLNDNYLGGGFGWQATPLSRLDLSVDRKFLETTEESSVGIIQTTRKAIFTQSITPFLNGTFTTGIDSYQYVASDATEGRRNNVYYAGVGGNYKVSDTINLQVTYNSFRRDSSRSASDEYRNNQVQISIIYRR